MEFVPQNAAKPYPSQGRSLSDEIAKSQILVRPVKLVSSGNNLVRAESRSLRTEPTVNRFRQSSGKNIRHARNARRLVAATGMLRTRAKMKSAIALFPPVMLKKMPERTTMAMPESKDRLAIR